MDSYRPTARTQVKRLPQRGHYDKDTVHQILDEAFLCHVGFVSDNRPVTIPTAYARDGETLYLHGSPASRMLKTLKTGIDVCVTVTLVDGLVLARSAFHHSINYRSVVIFGRAQVVADPEEKRKALRTFSEHLIPGRWQEVREPDESELKATIVLALPLEEVSAKVRSGPPVDDERDMERPVWAGVLPLELAAQQPLPDPRTTAAAPDYVRRYSRRRGADGPLPTVAAR